LSRVYLEKKQHDQAIAAAERALALDPNYADSYLVLGQSLNFAGRWEEAIGLVEKAMRLSPRSPLTILCLCDLGRAYYWTGRYEEAIAALKRACDLNPDFIPPHLSLAFIYSESGREAEARTEAAEVLRINSGYSLEVWRQRALYKDPAVVERLLAALRKAGLE